MSINITRSLVAHNKARLTSERLILERQGNYTLSRVEEMLSAMCPAIESQDYAALFKNWTQPQQQQQRGFQMAARATEAFAGMEER